MIGRRTWLRGSVHGVLAAWVSTGHGPVGGAAFGQSTPVPSARPPRRYTVRRPAFANPTGTGRTVPEPLRPDRDLERRLAAVREQHEVPALIGAIVRGERLASIAAVGVRRMGSSDPMQVTDQVHIGSCTKAMTATLLGMLVEDALLTWSSTIRDVFPDVASRLDPEFQGVTLSELLSHTAGLPADTPWWRFGGGTPTTQRRSAVLFLMSARPSSLPGTRYVYSNAGYVVAGHMAEQVTGQSWEELMRQLIFQPLGMTSAGFGPPSGKSSRPLEAAWGHRQVGRRLEPIRRDNPPCMGPAGTVHCSMADWGKFASLHLLGSQGKSTLLRPETIEALHRPPAGSEYAGGWIVLQRPWAGGTAFTHSGSNTYWYCTIWIAPGQDFATLVATNRGGDTASEACEMATRELIAHARTGSAAGP